MSRDSFSVVLNAKVSSEFHVPNASLFEAAMAYKNIAFVHAALSILRKVLVISRARAGLRSSGFRHSDRMPLGNAEPRCLYHGTSDVVPQHTRSSSLGMWLHVSSD